MKKKQDNQQEVLNNLKVPLEDEVDDRGHWGSKAEFVLSCIGLSVGLGNVWRFPYLAYENGGAAFLIPYVIMMVLIGKPMYLMETAWGQYSQLGPMDVWRCAPVMKGVGVAMLVRSVIGSIFYNQLMVYTLYYIFATFTSEVPWANCNHTWADSNCFDVTGGPPPCKLFNTTVEDDRNCTYGNESSATQFWERGMLRIDKRGLTTFGDIGVLQWDLCLCLLLSWTIVCLCLFQSIKTSGKVVYFTATFPYVVLIAMLIIGLRLEGAITGLKYLFVPKWEQLMDVQVWRRAAEQVFYSLSVSSGGIIMYSSYNKFRNKVHIDAFVISSLDFVTSLIATVAIFSVLGAMAHDLNVDVRSVAKSGTGLAFITYPEAISRTLPAPQLWAFLFFFMLFTLGLDSQFAGMEVMLTTIYDNFPRTRRWKTLMTIALCTAYFFMGIPLCYSCGQYVFYLIDYFMGTGKLLLAVCELIGLHWIYGVGRFCDDIKFMLGYRPSIFWRVCWVFISPVGLGVLFVLSCVRWRNPTYGSQEFPQWALNIGWALVCLCLVWIPIVFLYTATKRFLTAKGDCCSRLSYVFAPAENWGVGCPEARRELLEQQASEQLSARKKLGIDNLCLEPDYRPDYCTKF